MSNLVTLSCPTCGAPLKIPQDIERFACIYCGQEHAVQRGEGIVSLKPVVAKLDAIQATSQQILSTNVKTTDAAQRVVAELALQRLDKEFQTINQGCAAAISLLLVGGLVGGIAVVFLGATNVISIAIYGIGALLMLALLGGFIQWLNILSQMDKQRTILAKKK